MGNSVHPSALVDASSGLGEGCEVGPFAVIEADVRIGDGCVMGAHSVIKSGTRLGDGNRIHEHAVLGGVPQDLKFEGKPSRLILGDGNVVREGVTVHRSSREGGATRLGDGCFLMAYAHIAHDCRLGDGVIIANNVCLAGHVEIGDQAFISGGVVIHQFTRIGRLSMIGGNAKVTQDVLPYFLADGVPARTRGLNLVGLRRSGLSPAERRTLKQARQILFSDASPLEDKLRRLDDLDSRAAAEVAAFIRSSRRGFC